MSPVIGKKKTSVVIANTSAIDKGILKRDLYRYLFLIRSQFTFLPNI